MFCSRLSRAYRLRFLVRPFFNSSYSHCRISNSPRLSDLPQVKLGFSTCIPALQQNLRNYATGKGNGKGSNGDPFGGDKTRDDRKGRQGSSVKDAWDFSGEGDTFGPSNVDDFGAEKRDEKVDWGSLEPEGKLDQGKEEEQWGGFGEVAKDGSWDQELAADWPTAETPAEPTGAGDKGFESKEAVSDDWATAEGFRPWDVVEGATDQEGVEVKPDGDWQVAVQAAQELEREKEEKQLQAVLEGPNRAFGDLIAASGITEVQIESLIVMKDLEGVEGLPPLREIEDARLARLERKSIRGQLEQQRQEETAKARVRQVDEKGRAYGTGRRKTSVARVWIQPGIGRFIVNEKPFDAYFTQLAHRADVLAPFDKTKTLGLWDIFSTVKGGGVSGQVGAVRLGISRALQNWEPGLRPYLRSAGLLTRDPRMVERKKPGKAKARKSFQWVKR